MAKGYKHWNGIGGWGAYTQLTDKQQHELATCLNCPLPECCGAKDEACPLHPRHKEYRQMLDTVCAAVQRRGQNACMGRALVATVWEQWHGS